MSLQVCHVSLGIGKVTGERNVNSYRVAGALMAAVSEWLGELPAWSGVTLSLWQETYPGLILLSPYRVTDREAGSLKELIEQHLLWNLGEAPILQLLISSRHGEVRLLISDAEYHIASCASTTSTPKVMEPIPVVHGE